MAKAGELQWDELYKTGQLEQDPISKQYSQSVKTDYHKTGPKPTKEELRKDAEFIMKGWLDSPEAQWKDEDHLSKEIVSQEQAEEMNKGWENALQGFYDAANAPVNEDEQGADWGSGMSFNSTISEEERLKRNMHTGE